MKRAKDVIINILREVGEEGITQAELVKLTSLSRSRVSEILRQLEREGRVIRIRHAGKTYIVKLSCYTHKNKIKTLKLGILRALEYPFIIPFMKKLRERGFRVQLYVYDNAIPATHELSRGSLDLALTPLVTQFYFHELTGALKIIGGGALGGAYIVLSSNKANIAINDLEHMNGASTKISTMELCGLAVTKGKFNRVYVNKVEDYLKYMVRKIVDYSIIWQPYAKILEERKCRILAKCEDVIGPYYCCTLAINTGISDNLIDLITRLYIDAFKGLQDNVKDYMKALARIIDIDEGYVNYSLNSYSFIEYINLKLVVDTLRRAHVNLPNPTRIIDVIWRGAL